MSELDRTPHGADAPEAAKTWHLTALTDIWTGDAERKGDHLIPTGLLGSIRWWFEVVVRGLGGSACDPSQHQFPEDRKKRCEAGHHCVVCELFGCTGWARKFRFDVLDETDQIKTKQIEKGDTFKLRFTPLRPVRPEEWALLDLTLRLIAEYGAIGGKTVYKPSEEPGLCDLSMDDFEDASGTPEGVKVKRARKNLPLQQNDFIECVGSRKINNLKALYCAASETGHGMPVKVKIQRSGEKKVIDGWGGKRHHQDLGLVQLSDGQVVLPPTKSQLKRFVSRDDWRKAKQVEFAWASLANFWCVPGRYLARQNGKGSTFNRVLGRKEPKNQGQQLRDKAECVDEWLAGKQQESKKVFSFKSPARTFGFVKPGRIDFSAMRKRLRDSAWPDLRDDEFIEGQALLDRLLGEGGGATE